MWLDGIYAKLKSRQCWSVVSLICGGGGGRGALTRPFCFAITDFAFLVSPWNFCDSSTFLPRLELPLHALPTQEQLELIVRTVLAHTVVVCSLADNTDIQSWLFSSACFFHGSRYSGGPLVTAVVPYTARNSGMEHDQFPIGISSSCFGGIPS